jgi:hypothetical protein
MGVSAPPMDPTQGGGLGGLGGGASAGGGQGTLILQQVQQLLAQLMQSETDPNIQQGVGELLKAIDPLMQAIGQNDAQAMNSGLNTPGGALPPMGGAMPPEGSPAEEAGESPAAESSEDKTFSGAKKAAMANFKGKGHFSKKGSKGENLQTQKTKNRTKGK